MNTLTDLLKSRVAFDLGWALLHFLWQGALLAAMCGLAWHWLRHHSARSRYVAGCFFLLAMGSAPVITYAVRSARTAGSASSPVAFVTRVSAKPQAGLFPGSDGNLLGRGPTQVATSARPWAWPSSKVLSWCVGLWFVGVFLLSSRLLLGWVRAQRLKWHKLGAVDSSWQEKLAALERRVQLPRAVRLFQSALVEVPTVVGWLRPVILWPASSLIGLTPSQLEAILAHELAHIRRYDYPINLLQSLLETLLFYHPAVWWISQRVREERENCCDDVAVTLCGDRLSYARALATLEELRQGPARWAMAADGGNLLRRIQRLLGLSADREFLKRDQTSRLLGSAAVASFVAGLFLLRLAAAAEPAVPGHEIRAADPLARLVSPSAGTLVVAAADKAAAPADKEPGAKGAERPDALVKRSFPVTAGGQLVMSVDRGAVTVATGEGTQVEVEATRRVKGATEANPEDLLTAHQVSFVHEGNRVEVSAKFLKEPYVSDRDKSRLQVEYRVIVPQKFNLDLKTAGGQITIGDVEGEVKAATAGGPLNFGNIQGTVHASTAGGPIKLAGASSTVNMKTAGGNIELGEVSGETTVKTAGGSIKVTKAKGKLQAETAGGNIEIHEAQNTVKAKTAGGSISAEFSAQPEDDCMLSSGAGNIRIKLPAELSFDIEAKTAGGKVNTDLELTGTEQRKAGSLHGTLNKGGKTLALKTNGGNIAIEKR